MITSPTRSVPLRTSTVAVGPPGSRPDSMTLPLARRLGLALSSSRSAWSRIISISLSTPCLVSADTSTKIVSPPQSSGTRPLSCNCWRTFSGVGVRVVDFVDRHDDRHLGRAGMVERLEGLRHDAVVGGHHQHDDVGDVGPARAHGAEGGVAGRVEERDLRQLLLALGVREGNGVGADVLGDAAGFAGGDVGLADHVEQRGLAVVDVAHDRDDRARAGSGPRACLRRPVRPS